MAVVVWGCSGQDAADAKQAPQESERLKIECDGGEQSACADYKALSDACRGHAAFGGLNNAEDVSNCAAMVRRIRNE